MRIAAAGSRLEHLRSALGGDPGHPPHSGRSPSRTPVSGCKGHTATPVRFVDEPRVGIARGKHRREATIATPSMRQSVAPRLSLLPNGSGNFSDAD
jgi:hypothetical protein